MTRTTRSVLMTTVTLKLRVSSVSAAGETGRRLVIHVPTDSQSTCSSGKGLACLEPVTQFQDERSLFFFSREGTPAMLDELRFLRESTPVKQMSKLFSTLTGGSVDNNTEQSKIAVFVRNVLDPVARLSLNCHLLCSNRNSCKWFCKSKVFFATGFEDVSPSNASTPVRGRRGRPKQSPRSPEVCCSFCHQRNGTVRNSVHQSTCWSSWVKTGCCVSC